MKIIRVLTLATLIFTSCTPTALDFSDGLQRLTPYLTSTSEVAADMVETQTPLPTSLPQPTPTPLIHVTALGETISVIALRYGLEMGAVLAANPQIDPYTLTVGTEVIIPLGDAVAQIGLASEPLALEVEPPDCTHTIEGGLWCFTLIRNPLAEPAAGVTTAFVLLDNTGEEAARLNAPLILHKIDAGDALPALAYFPPPIAEDYSFYASLLSALPLAEYGRDFLPIEIINEDVQLEGRSAQISGEISVEGESGREVEIHIAALAYDARGNLVGVRRAVMRGLIEKGNEVDTNIDIFSTGADIAAVTVKAEAYLINE